MIQEQILGSATTPDGGEITLIRDALGFLIMSDDRVLMSSRKHGSEEAMADVACPLLETLERPRVLVAGLGLGYTLRATLDRLPPTGEVVCIELIEAIVRWHRGPLGPVADHPMEDPRVSVKVGDVIDLIQRTRPDNAFDVVLLDVDNGPIPMTVVGNWWLYAAAGLKGLYHSIRPGGMLVVWSAELDDLFVARMEKAGFETEVLCVASRSGQLVDGQRSQTYVLFVGHR